MRIERVVWSSERLTVSSITAAAATSTAYVSAAATISAFLLLLDWITTTAGLSCRGVGFCLEGMI
jgi:hypothetical protein